MLCFFKHDNVSRPTSKFKAETSLKISGFAVGSVFHCTLSPFHGLYVCGAFELCFFHAHPSWLTRNLGIRSPVPTVFLRAWLDVLFFCSLPCVYAGIIGPGYLAAAAHRLLSRNVRIMIF